MEILIENDESYTDLSNKLYSDQYHSTRRNPGYTCTPLLAKFSSEAIPSKLQDIISNAIDNDESEYHSGMIPEINLAYFITGNIFNYWTIGQRKSRFLKLELDNDIVAVGLVKPPSGFFSSQRCDHILMFSSDHFLIGYEVSFTREINR